MLAFGFRLCVGFEYVYLRHQFIKNQYNRSLGLSWHACMAFAYSHTPTMNLKHILCTLIEDIGGFQCTTMTHVASLRSCVGFGYAYLVDINILEFDASVLSMHASLAFVGVESQNQQQI